MELCENSVLYSVRVKDLFANEKLNYSKKVLCDYNGNKKFLNMRELITITHSIYFNPELLKVRNIPFKLYDSIESIFEE